MVDIFVYFAMFSYLCTAIMFWFLSPCMEWFEQHCIFINWSYHYK